MEQQLFDLLAELEARDQQERAQGMPQPQRMRALRPESAKLLAILAISKKAQHIVEVGSGMGYSTLWLAYAASITGGKVLTCEIDPARAAQAQTHLERAGLSQYVDLLVGDAREVLRQQTGPIDFVFIDGEKGQYETYFDVIYKRLSVGGTIVADNVVSHEDQLADYTTYVQNHPNLESITVAIGRGLEITVKTA